MTDRGLLWLVDSVPIKGRKRLPAVHQAYLVIQRAGIGRVAELVTEAEEMIYAKVFDQLRAIA